MFKHFSIRDDQQRNYYNNTNNSSYYSLFNQPNIMIPRNIDTSQEPSNRSFATFHQQVIFNNLNIYEMH
jgi:hypothetical protein